MDVVVSEKRIINGACSVGFHKLIWDTKFFGINCYELEEPRGIAHGLEEILKKFPGLVGARFCVLRCRENNPIFSFIPSTWKRIETVDIYQREFTMKDISIQMRKCPEATIKLISPTHGNKSIQVSDVEDAKELARKSFRYTRFYNDKNFPNKLVDEMYANQVQSAADDPTTKLLIARIDGELAGFHIFKFHNTYFNTGRTQLMAIDKKYRTRGLASDMICTIPRYIEKDMIWEYGLQSHHEHAIFLMQGMKFRKIDSVDIYHHWSSQ